MPPILRIRDETGKVVDIPAIVGPPGKDGMFDLGENITEGSANDTVAFWAAKGSGQAWFSATNMLVNQPAQYGFVISYTNGADVFQMFSDQTNGVTYFRYGDNVNNWFKHWTALELPGMATTTELGLVMVDGNNGIGVNTENGNLFIKQASNSEIDGKEHSYKSITPENLDYAVKAALTNNANELSDTERASALGWLGAQQNFVTVNILETICENLELSDSYPSHAFDPAITLEDNALYYCAYDYYANGEYVPGDSGYGTSKLTDGYVRWLTPLDDNSITLTSAGISDSWRGSGKVSKVSIYKISVDANRLITTALFSSEGCKTKSSGSYSHAEGLSTTASGSYSHAEGGSTTASGSRAHAEGNSTTASGQASHAEGGYFTPAEGQTVVRTIASGYAAHAEGISTNASGSGSHAEGGSTKASAHQAHAEGYITVASGNYSHAEGFGTTASGYAAHAEGYYSTALSYQHAQGHYNDTSVAIAGSGSGTYNGTAFVIGNGTASAGSNAFRVTYDGVPYAKSSFTTTGCDYAEYFEWLDGNPNSEDRRGYFVTLDGERIKIAEPEDYILGVVSGQPSVIGNGDESWMGRYVLDDFGAFVYESFEYEAEVIDEETGETKTVTRTGTKYKENPDYDPSRSYIHRENRPEWDAVGMLGVLSVWDDGTCEVNGFCEVSKGGIATKSESGYRVAKRVNDHIVKIIFK